MIRHFGNIWSVWEETDLLLVPSNSYITRLTTLVMGRGLAKQVADRYPSLPGTFGRRLAQGHYHLGFYGLLLPEPFWKFSGQNPATYPESKIGLFQTKSNWMNDADLKIIERSTEMLKLWASRTLCRIDMGFPGIGNGHLPISSVLPIVARLPDNVHLWELS